MIPDDIRAALTADALKFAQTRWTFAQATQNHVIEVLEVRGDKAFCATLYSDPFHHWQIPLAEFFSEFSAFWYLGTVEELQWIRSGEWIYDTQAPFSSFPFGGIKNIDGDKVNYTAPGRTNGSIPLHRFRERFRAITDEELRSLRDRHQPMGVDEYMMSTMGQDQARPIMGQMPVPMLASAGRVVIPSRRMDPEPYMRAYSPNAPTQNAPAEVNRPASWDHLMADDGTETV